MMRPHTAPKGVLFDMDGLIFDSERVGVDMMMLSGKKMGLDIPRELVLSGLGCTREKDRMTYEAAIPGIDFEMLWDGFIDGLMTQALTDGMPFKKGARELVLFLKDKSVPMALATSSGEKIVNAYFSKYDIRECFSAVICGSGRFKSKPAPDIFLAAAEAIGVPPTECIVFEDSVNGIKAGRAAGCSVCMVPDLIPYTDELAPYTDFVKTDLTQCMELF